MDHLVRHVQPANLQVLLPMSASFLTRSLMEDNPQQQQQLEQQQGDSGDSSTASPGDTAAADSSSSSASEAVTAADVDAALNGGRQLSGKYAMRTKKSMVILSDYAVCRSFAAALHGYSKSVVGPVLSQQPPQQSELDAAANGSRSSSSTSQQPQWFIDHDTPVHYVLPPLQKVAEWLAVGLEDAIITALQGQEGASVSSAAAEALENGSSSDSSSSDDRPQSPKKAAKQQQQQWTPQIVAAQVKSASQAAACSLVLITLLARAAVPVLQELQLSLQELPTATSAAGSGNSSSSSNPSPAAADADALVTEAGAVDLLSGLMFVRAAYQALCARCYFTQVLNGLPAKLNGARPVAGATADDVAALQAVKEALKGEGLARGWAHLVQPVPPGVVVRVRGFQDRHPGDFVANMNLLQQLLPVGVAEASSSSTGGKDKESADDEAAAAAVPQMMLKMTGEMRQQLDVLLTDLLGLFGSLLGEVPLPVGCNNPACTNLEGVAEASLSVNKRCKSCLAAHYCSKQCQTEHWAAHKGACLRIRSLSQK
jgi:hypothetical protein